MNMNKILTNQSMNQIILSVSFIAVVLVFMVYNSQHHHQTDEPSSSSASINAVCVGPEAGIMITRIVELNNSHITVYPHDISQADKDTFKQEVSFERKSGNVIAKSAEWRYTKMPMGATLENQSKVYALLCGPY